MDNTGIIEFSYRWLAKEIVKNEWVRIVSDLFTQVCLQNGPQNDIIQPERRWQTSEVAVQILEGDRDEHSRMYDKNEARNASAL
jgi:hypothetical protein